MMHLSRRGMSDSLMRVDFAADKASARSRWKIGPHTRWLAALAAYGVLNAVLYASLLPLWEGFDEPFHYAYVERLATHGDFSIVGKTPLTSEIWQSLHLAPGSYLVKRNLPFVTSFSEYFALPPAERLARRARLLSLSPALRLDDVPGTSNYEAQQPPLAYLVMAVPDRFLAGVPLPTRILRLRVFCAVPAALLIMGLTLWLANLLGLNARAQYSATFVVLSSEMLYACVAHVANEWLVIPLILLILIAAIRFQREPRFQNGALFGAALASALLAKSYALSWALFGACVLVYRVWSDRRARLPAALAVGIVAIIAGPWYARNLQLYRNIGGIQLAERVGIGDALRTLPSLAWMKILIESIHGALWTGNNSFTSFSAWTLNLVLVLMAVASALWLGTIRNSAHAADEWLIAAGCASYVPALIYYCGMTSAYFTGESGVSLVEPWYLQILSVPAACLLFLGCSRSGRSGHLTSAVLVMLSAYMLCATYLVKLIPLYSGQPPEGTRLMEICRWYIHDTRRHELLANTALASPGAIWVLTGAVALLGLTLSCSLAASRGDLA
jgi:hypothetical protein